MKKELEKYRQEMQQELEDILAYWIKYTVDYKYGGFVGKIDNDNRIDEKAAKGSVLNSRILWSFSAAYNLKHKPQYLQVAERAYKYISTYFVDKEFGGVYWTVDYKGDPLDTKKQVYALAFTIYGLSEYYKALKDEEAKELAISLYRTIVERSYDEVHSGYIEALARDWAEISDIRLSAKDANERKSMNTHLHVLEGFANLYRIWPDEGLKQRIEELIYIFLNRIIDANTNHLYLFFDDEWNVKSDVQSYGHDIEAAWLVQEAAKIIQNEKLFEEVKHRSVKIADAAAKGLDKVGGLSYEYDGNEKELVKEKHWWPQAEAMVGYFNAWQTTEEDSYLERSLNSWRFIKKYILNKEKGEWYWGVTQHYEIMERQDKVGIWKCPYHNSRACIEIIRRIDSMNAEKNLR
jgi:cellobiose epimerase